MATTNSGLTLNDEKRIEHRVNGQFVLRLSPCFVTSEQTLQECLDRRPASIHIVSMPRLPTPTRKCLQNPRTGTSDCSYARTRLHGGSCIGSDYTAHRAPLARRPPRDRGNCADRPTTIDTRAAQRPPPCNWSPPRRHQRHSAARSQSEASTSSTRDRESRRASASLVTGATSW
jgi:hypothetical protein